MKPMQTLKNSIFILFILSRAVLFGQTGEAGVESAFSIPIGARAMALGGGTSIFPDPSFWSGNPAGLTALDSKAFAFSLMPLFEGAQYLYAGYVHPTLSAGVFGVSVSRIGMDGISETVWSGDRIMIETGRTFSSSWTQFNLAYAGNVRRWLALGLNVSSLYQSVSSSSATGFGLDAGLRLSFPEKILPGTALGLGVVNVLKPKFKLADEIISLPTSLRMGLAKEFTFGLNRMLVALDIDRIPDRATRLHAGLEYDYHHFGFLRLGMDQKRDQKGITAGAGLRFKGFEIDYALSQIGDPVFFNRSHQFSLVLWFGQNLTERRKSIEAARAEEIQKRFNERVTDDRLKRIDDALQSGKNHLNNQDYLNARLEFARVLKEDPEHEEAKRLMTEADQSMQALQKNREESLINEDREKENEKRDLDFINQKNREGLKAFDAGDYRTAISAWQEALSKDSGNVEIRSYIAKTLAAQEENVNRLIARAQQFKREENISSAIQSLEEAKTQAQGNPPLMERVTGESAGLERDLNFLNNYQSGLQRYNKGDFEEAAKFFKKALEYNPQHERTKELYRNSMVRSSAGRKKDMSEAVKDKYLLGVSLYTDGRYEEALKIWEEALTLDPNNVKVLEAIEGVKTKMGGTPR
jgi:tetratricopeptide (TPR) repeat protein